MAGLVVSIAGEWMSRGRSHLYHVFRQFHESNERIVFVFLVLLHISYLTRSLILSTAFLKIP